MTRRNEIQCALRSGDVLSLSCTLPDPNEDEDPLDGFELTAIHRCWHVFERIGQDQTFASYYWEQRCLQLASELNVHSTSFSETYKSFLAQVLGFYLIDIKVARKTKGLVVSQAQLNSSWESTAVTLSTWLQRELEKIQEPTELMLVCSYASLVPVVLSVTGGLISGLMDGALETAAGQYHRMLQSDLLEVVASSGTTMSVTPFTWKDTKSFEEDLARLGPKAHEKNKAPVRFPAHAKHSKVASAIAQAAHDFIQVCFDF